MYTLFVLHSDGSLSKSFEFNVYIVFSGTVFKFLTDGCYTYVDCQKDYDDVVYSVTFKFND